MLPIFSREGTILKCLVRLNGSWRNSTLYIRRGSEAFLPSALEVLRSVEDGEHVWPDLPPGKSGIIEKLRFSPYPISLRLVVGVNTADGSGLIVNIAGRSRGKDVIVCETLPAKEHMVLGDTWYPVDQDSVAAVLRVLDESGAQPGPLISLRAFLNLRRAVQAGAPVEDRTSDAILPPMLFVPPEGDSPHGVNATLYGYQDDGWRWLKFMASQHMGGILADEMGLGKTLQIISLLSDAGVGQAKTTPALIVAPGSLLENWKREFTKFAPALRILKHHGVDRTGRAQQLAGYEVVVTSYDTVVRDGGMFGMIEWPVVVLDEAQYIRNPGAIRTRAVKALHRGTGIAVTGTPLENRLSDLWSLMDFAIPGHLGTLGEFQTAFEEVR